MTKSKKQLKIVVEQQTVRELRQAVKLLKRLPKDFRDIEIGSRDWEAFAKVTDRRKEMEKWSSGPVLCLQEPNKAEEIILGKENITLFRSRHAPDWPSTRFEKEWATIIYSAEFSRNCSWIYLPDEEPKVIAALNILLSRFEYNVRVRGQILSERTGRPIGIVH